MKSSDAVILAQAIHNLQNAIEVIARRIDCDVRRHTEAADKLTAEILSKHHVVTETELQAGDVVPLRFPSKERV
jgi:hypothetical protein